MNLAFTLCSINYLGQAKTLSDSMRLSNPSWEFIIGLVDKNVQNIDLSFLGCDVLEVEKVKIEGFDNMVQSYDIVEFITAVKPFYFTHFLENRKDVDKIIYFDPDIMVFTPLTDLEQKLEEYDIVLTPHFTKPIEDDLQPTERHVFRTGVFNLGFLAVKRSINTMAMLTWWENKLRTECILDLSRGYFVDQLWMSLAPSYFDKVLIDKYPGYNMAHWNLHEREITNTPEGYYVNGVPLVFYHFSHYSAGKPNEIAAFHTRFAFNNRPDVKQLFDIYHANLITNKYFEMKKISCYYMRNESQKKFKKSVGSFFRNNLPAGFKRTLESLLKG